MEAITGLDWLFVAAVAATLLAMAAGIVAAGLRWRLELVARAEHEIRGALTAVSLALDSSRRGIPGPAAADPLSVLEAQLDRARAGLDDLETARRARLAPSRPEPVSIDRFVRDTAAGWEPFAARRGRAIDVEWRGEEQTVVADRGRLAQALGNLIANSVEHGSGPVRIRVRATGTSVRIAVSDDGPGPSGQRTFEPTRLGRGQVRAHERGRGLVIAARAAQEAGGRLTLAPGNRGPAVVVELPARRSP